MFVAMRRGSSWVNSLGRSSAVFLILEVDVSKRLPVGVAVR
jgi:hypothetical protein